MEGNFSPPSTLLAGEREIPLSKMRQVIGQRLSESKREAPHFYVTGEFDLEQAVQRLKTLPAPQPGLNDLLQYLTVQTLLHVPELNVIYEQGGKQSRVHEPYASCVSFRSEAQPPRN